MGEDLNVHVTAVTRLSGSRYFKQWELLPGKEVA